MNIECLRYYIIRAMENLSDLCLVKLGLAGIFITLQFHFLLFILFCILVLIDLCTKWLSLAREVIEIEEPTIIDEIKAIPLAHRKGVISSNVVKTRFIGKILVYLVVVIVAGLADIMLIKLGKVDFFVTLAISYLSAGELLSVIENLDKAGVDGLKELIGLISKAKVR